MPRERSLKVLRPKQPSKPNAVEVQRGPRSVKVQPVTDPDEPPASFGGTKPEWLVYQWLVRRGLEPGIDFKYQVSVQGGRRKLFGAVADFIINAGPWSPLTMVWRIQTYYWHFSQGPEVIANDLQQRLRLEQAGWTVIDVFDLDLEDRNQRDVVLQAALDGVELIHTSAKLHGPVRSSLG